MYCEADEIFDELDPKDTGVVHPTKLRQHLSAAYGGEGAAAVPFPHHLFQDSSLHTIPTLQTKYSVHPPSSSQMVAPPIFPSLSRQRRFTLILPRCSVHVPDGTRNLVKMVCANSLPSNACRRGQSSRKNF